MYRIFCDDQLIFSSKNELLKLQSANISLEVNTSGTLVMTMPFSHPYINSIEEMKSILTLYKKNKIIWRGRVLSESKDFLNSRQFICEGELSFFNDSIVRPYEHTGSVKDYFTYLVNEHNKQVDDTKKFVVGNITVVDQNDVIVRGNAQYPTTLEEIKEKLVNMLGGYIFFRTADGVRYVDYLIDFTMKTNQKIKIRKNLIDFKKINSFESAVSGIIPLGCQLEDEDGNTLDRRLTIEKVNGGKDYLLDEEACKKYGKIFATYVWDDVTVVENLLRKAQQKLAELKAYDVSIELSAADLSYFDKSIQDFTYCQYVEIISEEHNLNEHMLISKQYIDLLNVVNDNMTVGKKIRTFSNESANGDKYVNEIFKTVGKIDKDYVGNGKLNQQITTLISLVEQTENQIKTMVQENYFTAEEVASQISTTFTQLSNSFNFEFNEIYEQITELNGSTSTEFNKIAKYIRFIDGHILIGQVDNSLILDMTNDKLSFKLSEYEVAYMTDNKLYITEAEIINKLKIGNFGYIPRSNGSLSFRFVGV